MIFIIISFLLGVKLGSCAIASSTVNGNHKWFLASWFSLSFFPSHFYWWHRVLVLHCGSCAVLPPLHWQLFVYFSSVCWHIFAKSDGLSYAHHRIHTSFNVHILFERGFSFSGASCIPIPVASTSDKRTYYFGMPLKRFHKNHHSFTEIHSMCIVSGAAATVFVREPNKIVTDIASEVQFRYLFSSVHSASIKKLFTRNGSFSSATK